VGGRVGQFCGLVGSFVAFCVAVARNPHVGDVFVYKMCIFYFPGYIGGVSLVPEEKYCIL